MRFRFGRAPQPPNAVEVIFLRTLLGHALGLPAFALLASAVLPQCGFPDHKFSDENCFNGIDDDSNGFADCDDWACISQTACVPPAPSGWTGPVAIWQGAGSESPPSCSSSGFPGFTFPQLYLTPNNVGKNLETCPQCTCSGAPSATGGTTACYAQLQFSNSLGCGVPGTLMKGPNNQYGFPVGQECTSVPFNSFIPGTMFFSEVYATNSSCSSQVSGPTNIPAPTFDQSLRACNLSGTALGGCSDKKQTCVPRPQGGYMPYACIYQQGATSSCPELFPTSYVFHEYNDGRICQACGCSITNTKCESSGSGSIINYYRTDPLCSGNGYFKFAADPNCVNIPPDDAQAPQVYAKLTDATPVVSTGATCAPTGGSIAGDVVPKNSYTFCCVPVD